LKTSKPDSQVFLSKKNSIEAELKKFAEMSELQASLRSLDGTFPLQALALLM
jgi:hypothetical protein